MTETDHWLVRYEQSHRDIRNKAVYWCAVPGLVIGTVGLFWALPVPAELTRISPLLNWGSLFLMATLVYYFIISIPLAIGMLPFIFGVVALETYLASGGARLPAVATVLTVLSVGGLYAGRPGDRDAPGMGQDIQMMMIAPVWMLSVLYRRLGIPH